MSETAAKPTTSKDQAGADPYSVPLEKIDVSDAELFETDTLWGYFAHLRNEDPVHYCAESEFGLPGSQPASQFRVLRLGQSLSLSHPGSS